MVVPLDRLTEFCPAWAEVEVDAEDDALPEALVPELFLGDCSLDGF
jgi:hypothetical protein